jgi:hypothetical protein
MLLANESGCLWEPYPAFVPREIAIAELPDQVRAGFAANHPDATIVVVQEMQFKGKVAHYRIGYASTDGLAYRAYYNTDGTAMGDAHLAE